MKRKSTEKDESFRKRRSFDNRNNFEDESIKSDIFDMVNDLEPKKIMMKRSNSNSKISIENEKIQNFSFKKNNNDEIQKQLNDLFINSLKINDKKEEEILDILKDEYVKNN